MDKQVILQIRWLLCVFKLVSTGSLNVRGGKRPCAETWDPVWGTDQWRPNGPQTKRTNTPSAGRLCCLCCCRELWLHEGKVCVFHCLTGLCCWCSGHHVFGLVHSLGQQQFQNLLSDNVILVFLIKQSVTRTLLKVILGRRSSRLCLKVFADVPIKTGCVVYDEMFAAALRQRRLFEGSRGCDRVNVVENVGMDEGPVAPRLLDVMDASITTPGNTFRPRNTPSLCPRCKERTPHAHKATAMRQLA